MRPLHPAGSVPARIVHPGGDGHAEKRHRTRGRAAAAALLAAATLAAAGLPPGYPHNDAAAYHRMVELWLAEGRPVLIGWNEMTLLGHLLSGVVLGLLGFAGVAARQLLVGVQAAAAAALVASGRRNSPASWAVLCSLAWLVHPASLFAGTSFMTEVPAALGLLGAALLVLRGLEGAGAGAAAGASLAGVWGFSVRQSLAALPAAAALAAVGPSHPRERRALLAVAAATAAGCAAVWLYRSGLPLAAVRPLRDIVLPPRPGSVIVLARHAVEAAALAGLALLPIAAAALGSRSARRAAAVALAAGLAAAAAGWHPFWPNTITARGLLPDLLPPPGPEAPVLGREVLAVLGAVGYAAAAGLLASLPWRRLLSRPADRFLALLLSGYVASVAVARSPFDRWLVPVLPLAALAAHRWLDPSPRARRAAAACLAVALAGSAAAVRCTHVRQRAVRDLAAAVAAAGVPPERIDGGFEWNLAHQPVPFRPGEARVPPAGEPWYMGYPFTRLEPLVRLWTGSVPPPGWHVSSRHLLPFGPPVLVLSRDPDLARRLPYTPARAAGRRGRPERRGDADGTVRDGDGAGSGAGGGGMGGRGRAAAGPAAP